MTKASYAVSWSGFLSTLANKAFEKTVISSVRRYVKILGNDWFSSSDHGLPNVRVDYIREIVPTSGK